jgi:hypothetical protein
MKTSKSIPAGIAALLLCVGAGCQKTPTVTAASPASVLEMETIPRPPARLTRGQYLIEELLQYVRAAQRKSDLCTQHLF